MPITKAMLDNWFTHHPPGPEDIEAYHRIRSSAAHLAEVIIDNTPSSADQTAAIRKVREAVMTANAARACYQEDDGLHEAVEIDEGGNVVPKS